MRLLGRKSDLFNGVAHSHSAYGYFVYKYVKHTYPYRLE